MRPGCAANVSQMLGPCRPRWPRPRSGTTRCWCRSGNRGSWEHGTIMPVTVEIRRASQGYLTRERGLRTRHAFSFGGHYDPENTGFGPLVCHDDHLVGSGLGFPDHPHAGVEIVTWVLEGELVHTDSTGVSATVTAGTVQVQATGSGIVHSETASPAGPARFAVPLAGAGRRERRRQRRRRAAVVRDRGGGLRPWRPGPGGVRARPRGRGAAADGRRDLLGGPARAGETLTLPDDPLQHVYVTRGALLRSSLAEPSPTATRSGSPTSPASRSPPESSPSCSWTFRR